jgi:aspartate/glutamate racemase
MAKKLACVHTGIGTVEMMANLAAEILPGVAVCHILDDGVVPDLVVAGSMNRNLTRRMINMYDSAELSGADVILLCCSSVGPTAEMARSMIGVPLVRIDAPMAERAVQIGKRIGLVATVDTTVEPSTELIKMKAREAGKVVEVEVHLCPDALFKLRAGDIAEHDRLVVEAVRDAATTCDVVVLAQGSMMRVLPLVADAGVAVLASPRLGLERVTQLLG